MTPSPNANTDFATTLLAGGLIGAHRGHRAHYPENTLAAFRDCARGCDFIELDVRFSRDGTPMVFHDPTLTRTTDFADCDRFQGHQNNDLAAFDVAALQHLDAGSWFYRDDPFEQIAAGRVTTPPASDQRQRIPTLAEALQVIAEIGMRVNIELKCLNTDADDSLDRVVDDIQAAGLVQGSLISAFDHTILRHLKARHPALATAALVEDSHPDTMLDYLADLGVAGYHVHEPLATASLIRTLRGAGLFVGVYTVNDAARKRALLSAGVGAVITDFLDDT